MTSFPIKIQRLLKSMLCKILKLLGVVALVVSEILKNHFVTTAAVAAAEADIDFSLATILARCDSLSLSLTGLFRI